MNGVAQNQEAGPADGLQRAADSLAAASDRTDQLERYAVHAAIQTQVAAAQTGITTTANLYLVATGAIWAIAVPNTFNFSDGMLVAAFSLHVLVSVLTSVALSGAATQVLQRFAFSQAVGAAFWPQIEAVGSQAMRHAKQEMRFSVLPGSGPRLFVKIWPLLPLMLIVTDLALIAGLRGGPSPECREWAHLLQTASAPHEVSRAHYLLDKSGCSVGRIDPAGWRDVQLQQQAARATQQQ